MLVAPREVALGGVYMPPLLVSGIAGLLLAYYTARLLTKFRLSRYFAAPSLVFVSLVVIYTGLIETFLIVG